MPKYLSGACDFLCHLYPDFDASRAHPSIQDTITGLKKVCTDPICCMLPICLTHLHSFLEIAISSQKYNDILFITILSCCFYDCHRLGELILKNGKDEFHWKKIIKCGSLIFDVDCIYYCLSYHKTDHFYHSTTVLFSPQEVADPVTLLQSFFCHHNPIHGSQTALFLCEDGSFPNCVWFDKRFFALINHYFGGHSLYARGATYFASLGLSEDVIQALGCWSSQAWTIYIRDNPTIHAELQLACLFLQH